MAQTPLRSAATLHTHTTNKNFTSWGAFFHDDNVAVPIVDRIIQHSHL
ncbi:hypothetical protein TVNIR_2831 [Thioalkalivibrio nitratireducens DSM 14787]|uniref:IstB-like ATP-binding domain-containing protein n=1 Tax=Thioalkalivibrio nitratireducens (strain DSM 14787 / UNIQEM 213 / ALEN2) TaxID=1255043 RepID=L0DY02_THIND|nr:hypothetical protein [Thioalkalivibrio nitratireducens]AGA34469.1 hypothetical protein TVNIR_2831 [Thioalkalivibrio nitratireducens DSM 14787]